VAIPWLLVAAFLICGALKGVYVLDEISDSVAVEHIYIIYCTENSIFKLMHTVVKLKNITIQINSIFAILTNYIKLSI
jgi:hypothetical protein